MNTLDEDVKIAERAMTSYMDEYREASEIWKTLENKAQVTIAVAGVFWQLYSHLAVTPALIAA
jgi:hypothetical protein